MGVMSVVFGCGMDKRWEDERRRVMERDGAGSW